MRNKSRNVNPFHNFTNIPTTRKITFTSICLSLVILFQFLEQFMPFGPTFIKINFSLLFILPIFYFAGPWYGVLALLSRFVFGFLFALGRSPLTQGSFGQLILLLSSSVAILLMYAYSWVFAKIKNHNKKVILISLFVTLTSSLVLTIMNLFMFTPMYMWAFQNDTSTYYGVDHWFDVSGAQHWYENNEFYIVKHFGIPNYWAGIITVYLTGNLTKFAIIFLAYYPFSKVLRVFFKNNI